MFNSKCTKMHFI